jgi:hypothetical protein
LLEQQLTIMFYLRNSVRKINNVLYQSSFSRKNTTNEKLILTNLTLNNISDLPYISDANLSFSFQFWFTLAFEIPSLICYFFVFIYIFTHNNQRQGLHNHAIIVLLFIAFFIVLFDYSWTVDSYRHEGQVWIASATFCKIWWLFDFGFYDACTVVLAWASFERHILIFHSNLLSTKRRRICIHYLPLIIILLYLSIFYIYAIFFPPCENEYDFTSPVCGAGPCYSTVVFLVMWSTVVNGIISTCLIILFNISLLVRILWQKRRHRPNWKKYKKMAFQLLSISALYLSLNFPVMGIALIQLAGYPKWGAQTQRYLLFFCTLIQFLLPFVCLTYLHGIWLHMKTLFVRDLRRVVPAMAVRTIPVLQQETRI